MTTLLQRFQHHLDATGILPAGSPVLAAVSGGADSVALLHLLHRTAPDRRFRLQAAHLDHALRPDSPADAAHVRDLCAALDVPLTLTRIDVAALAGSRVGGVEEAAREARRDFLRETAQKQGCRWIALAHQRDDQAETFLLRLLRGAGVTGLAGMRNMDPPFVRPLLPFSREEIVAWLGAEGIPWREDASNLDLAFTRNRVRHELLPQLESYNPAIRLRLAELCRQMAEDEDDWFARVGAGLERIAVRFEGECRLPCADLRDATPALAGRMVRAALKEVRGDLRRIEAAHVTAILDLVRGTRPQGEVHLPGGWVGRRYDWLLFRREPPSPDQIVPFDVPGPGLYPLPGGRVLAVALSDEAYGESAQAVEFDGHSVPFPLQVRGLRPGDRFRPEGMSGTKKLQDLFVDMKLPVETRRSVPLVFGAGTLLWVAGVRRSDGRHAAPGGGKVLRLELFGSGVAQAQTA